MEHRDIVNKGSTFHTFNDLSGNLRNMAVDHLRIYILCPCRRTPIYHPVLIFACLTGVSSLVVNICHWSSTGHSEQLLPRFSQLHNMWMCLVI